MERGHELIFMTFVLFHFLASRFAGVSGWTGRCISLGLFFFSGFHSVWLVYLHRKGEVPFFMLCRGKQVLTPVHMLSGDSEPFHLGYTYIAIFMTDAFLYITFHDSLWPHLRF